MNTTTQLSTLTTEASKVDTSGDLLRYTIYIVEGIILASGNLYVIFVIYRYRALRNQKEYVIIAGLSLADSMSGLAALTAGPYRINLILNGVHQVLVGRRHCFWTVHNLLWIVAFPLQGICLSLVSVDRLIAVCIPLRYLGFTRVYAQRMMGIAYAFGVLHLVIGGVLVWGETEPSVSAICLTGWSLLPDDYQFIYTIQLAGILGSIGGYALVMVVHQQRMSKMHFTDKVLEVKLKQQRRLTKSLGLSCIFTFILFGCPNIVIWMSYFFDFNYYLIVVWAYIINNINPILNPLIYFARLKELKAGMVALVKCKSMPADIAQWRGITVAGMPSQSAVSNAAKKSLAQINAIQIEEMDGSKAGNLPGTVAQS